MKIVLACALALTAISICVAQDANEEPAVIVEELQCKGNVATSCRFILGHLYISQGDALDEEEIQNAKLRLASLPNFELVDIRLEKGSAKGRAVVVVEVVEADPIAIEGLLGTSARLSSLSQVIAARISHQNLFGAGKILDLDLGGEIPIDPPTRKDVRARLQFVDPHLFDSKKYFLIAGASYENALELYPLGDFRDSERFGIDLSFGRRLWDFSYITAGYQYRPTSETYYCSTASSLSCATRFDFTDKVILLSYGWNSEDHPYFPTQGSRFNITQGFGNDQNYTTLDYRKTWSSSPSSIWSFKIGGTPGTEYRSALDEHLLLALSYSRPIEPSDRLGGIRRGRWFIEPGVEPVGRSQIDGRVWEIALKTGVRLETEAFGVVDLYFIGSTSWGAGK